MKSPDTTVQNQVEIEGKPPPVLQERAADRYGPNYLRETEIRTVHQLLETHPVVMITGGLGRGKSSFMAEAIRFTRQRQRYGEVARASYLFDVHSIDKPLRSGFIFPSRQALLDHYGITAREIEKSIVPLMSWLDHQPVGAQLENIPFSQRSILFLDAGDAFFLADIGNRHFPPYQSMEWNMLTKLKPDSDEYQTTLEACLDTQMQIERVEDEQRRKFRVEHDIDVKVLDEIIQYYAQHYEELLEERMVGFEAYRVFQITRDQVLDRLTKALKEGKIRLVLTDHNYNRGRLRRAGAKEADPYLMDKYDQLFAAAYRYDLSADYEVEKARLFLQRDRGITDPVLQDEIIAATGGSHKLMKLVITGDMIRKIRSAPLPEDRRNVLLAAIEPYRRYPESD